MKEMVREVNKTISIHVPAWGTTCLLFPEFTTIKHFNPRSRVGNDQRKQEEKGHNKDFNPRSRVGNDINIRYNLRNRFKFQSTFPRGERLEKLNIIAKNHNNFNPRSRVGNDPDGDWSGRYAWIFQSTFPRGERPHSTYINITTTRISIHVPAWGTTHNIPLGFNMDDISIHVPAWGTTLSPYVLLSILWISIHVPAWGTTIDSGRGFYVI